MYLCNASLGLSLEGIFRVNFTECNEIVIHGNENNGTNNASEMKKDALGAMQYIIAVIVLYGIAMLGVFGFGQFRRRKRRHENMDKETQEFLKNYDEVRRLWEQRSRVGAISSLLHQLHNEPVSNRHFSRNRPSVNSLAFLPITLSKITEVNSDVESRESSASLNSFGGLSEDDVTSSSDELKKSKPKLKRQESRISMLGSSRRKFSACKQCWLSRGIRISKHECLCLSSAPARYTDEDSSSLGLGDLGGTDIHGSHVLRLDETCL